MKCRQCGNTEYFRKRVLAFGYINTDKNGNWDDESISDIEISEDFDIQCADCWSENVSEEEDEEGEGEEEEGAA